MATQNINIGVNVSDNGTAKKVVKNFQEIESAATRAQRAAQSTLAPGGTSGSRRAAEPTGTQQMMSGQEYNRGRGSMGATGASARDFANQAQGLGGLVRLYATYAANLFAVSAAFNALKNAMDTANLVQGLDQLGAASGTALGTLSKRLVQATDGAISLREAMESTAKASSSGMSSENILRMGKVAKQASQALGVDMADAVNRITRGITKLEPELLDEIGIFTRVDAATKEYAKSVGKSTEAITDFEKRMAFANAVLAEGERKFSAIDLETNPYTKLVATLKDVAQSGLEVANKVLAPLIGFLAQNPTALATAVAALGIALVKQALPAIGQFKAGLSTAAEEATELSIRKARDAESAKMQIKQANLARLEDIADSELMAVNRAEEQMQKLRDQGFKKSSAAYRLLSADVADFSKENSAAIEKDSVAALTAAKRLESQAKNLEDTGADKAKVDALRARAQAQRDVVASVTKSIKAEKDLEAAANSSTKATLTQKLTLRAAQKAEERSIKQNIVTNAAYNGSLIGLKGAYALMKDEIEKSGLQLNKFQRGMLGARAGLAAFGGMVGTAVGAISGFLGTIGIITAAVAFLGSFFSTNAKQMSAFSGSIDATDESLINLGRTLDDIGRKPFGEQFNSQSLMASATAINEIANSVSKLITNTLDAEKAASGFDSFIDSFKSLWGGDLRTQFAKSISGTVFGTLDKLGDSPEAQKARASIASIIEVSPNSSRQDWQSAFKAIADNEPKLRLVERAMKDLGMATGITASKAQEFDNALKVSQEAYKNFAAQFKTSDPLAQLAESLISSGIKTAEALEVPELAIGRLASIVGDVDKLALFDAQDQKLLLQYGDNITEVNKNFEKNKAAVKSSKEEISKLSKELENLRTVSQYDQTQVASDEEMSANAAFAKAKKQLDERKIQIQKEQQLLANSQLEVAALTARFPELAAGQLAKGADLLSKSISASLAKGSNSFQEAVLASVGNLPGLAKERERIELLKLRSEGELIKIQTELARATILNSMELRRANARQAVDEAQSSIREARGAKDEKAEARLKEAQKTLEEIDKTIAVIKVDPSKALSAIKIIQSEIKAGNQVIKKEAGTLLGFINNLAGLGLQEQNRENNVKKAVYTAIIEQVKEETKESSKVLKSLKEENSLLLSNYAITKARTGNLTEAEIVEQSNARTQAILLDRDEKRLAIQEKIAVLDRAQESKATKLSDEVFQKQRGLLVDQSNNIVLQATNDIVSNRLVTTKELYTEQQRLVALEQELTKIKKSGTDAINEASIKISDIANQTAKDIGTYTPEYQAQQDALLKIAKTRGEAERAEQALTSAFLIRSYQLQAEAQLKIDSKASAESVNETMAKLTAEANVYGQKVLAINSARDAEINAINQVEKVRKEQSNFDATIESIRALDTVWANFGSTLADTVSIFVKLGKSQEQYANTLADLEFERDATTDTKKQLKLQDEIDKTRKASVKDEISGYAKTAGAAKSLFKEKTFAYKALAATEKVLHVTRLAMDIKEMISDTAKTGTSVANSVMRTGASVVEAGVDGVKAVVKAISSLPFPLNIAAGAATAAVVAGLLSQIGGKSPNADGGGGFIPNAEQRQETQGTAMGYDSEGNKIQVRRGVFGDTEAKSESIANSLELIRETSVDGLSYDNKMVTLLTSIDSGINKTAKGLYSIEGLRSGSMFGTVTGTQSGGGLLGTGFLGSKTSRNITDSGLIIEGTFGQLASDTNRAVIDFFEQVTVTKKSWYGKTRSWVETKREEIDDATSEFFKDIFGNATSLFIEVGSKAGIDANAITSILNNLNVGKEFASLRGLKGEEFQQELSAIIGTILDDASLAIFTSFEQYADFGEGMLETVVRVVDTNEKVNQAVKNLGITVDLTKLYGVTEALAKAAGGLEEFLDQSRFFTENFLTEAERVAPIQKAVVDRLAQLGYASVDTKTEFVALVKSLDLTSESGISTYQSLMDLAPGFHTVIEAVEDQSQALKDAAQGFRDFIQQIKDFKASLLLGASSTLTPQQKYVQAKAEFENVYAQALAGDSVAMGKVTSSAQSFLDASKTYFASSTAYTNDFNTVLSKLDTASISAEASASVADLQLGELSIQTTLLSDISSNIALIAGVPQAARGGRVSGLTLVGEMGPELVDFTYPGQVYPADQTRGMFAPQSSVSNNMSQVVQELRQVKQELAQLRKEQQQQTGDLIIANYDANNRTAEAVTTEVANAATSKEWQQRNKVAVV